MSRASAARDGVFKEKTFKEAWFSDKGAYPCMATFVFGLGFCSSFGAYYLSTCPDAKLVTGYSRSKMFRGALSDEYLKEDVDVCK
eukprot:CAMPEP_0185595534 /NCGR_PEP_ID=MMETSP0434-20130131/78776_1 /TAXON_ID=626734 ORGANISM="Favella taraikaensis, Strain Fe Narragansett Bay" /NCGR_SAMPLE_ID=MMETSP0434 /ASSEMBLY_ACC=CAM_ASM_000379 /LENGTH=84 /DNA_ID=CAMNT_0028223609 /DNA_START=30 /DNA_END=284 /DNA_ORIENTATION=-